MRGKVKPYECSLTGIGHQEKEGEGGGDFKPQDFKSGGGG